MPYLVMIGDAMKLKVYAKVNLALYITAKGLMHSLDSVMASIGVYDEINVVNHDSNVVYMDGVLADSTNSAYRAIEVFEQEYHPVSVKVDITKGIPMEAGLGGSSADSAGVLYALGKMYNKSVEHLAIRCGSDVPFMLRGGVARVEGIGDRLTPILLRQYPRIIIVKGEGGVSTSMAYKRYDDANSNISNHSLEAIEDIKRGDYHSEYLKNDLEIPAISLNEGVREVLDTLKQCGLKAVMSGSGSAVWAMGECIEDVAKALEKKYQFVAVTTIMDRGIEEYV